MEQAKENQADATTKFMSLPRGYINTVKVGFGLYDFQLIFSNVSVNLFEEENKQIDAPQYVAQMSPQHFKVLVRLLQEQMKKYEDKFGEIKIPDAPENKQ